MCAVGARSPVTSIPPQSPGPSFGILRRPRTAALAVLLAGILVVAATSAGGWESVAYKEAGPGEPLQVFWEKPAGWQATDRRPAIVFFHGGGWTSGTPEQFRGQCRYFASRGLVCFSAQYRLLDRKGAAPPDVCIRDARSAMRWVRARSAELGVDPERIASAGGSAGGHLAACVGMMDGFDDGRDDPNVSPRADAMILFNPVFDNGPGGWGHARVGERFRAFSPRHNVSADDPPAIVFLGSADSLVPVATAEAFRDAMRSAGVRCELRIYDGQAHGFFNADRDGGKWFAETLREADLFLGSLGWTEGDPPAVIRAPTGDPPEAVSAREEGRD